MALGDEGTAFRQEDGDLMQLYIKKEQNPQLHHCKSFKTHTVWAARRIPFLMFLDCALEEIILYLCLSLPFVRILPSLQSVTAGNLYSEGLRSQLGYLPYWLTATAGQVFSFQEVTTDSHKYLPTLHLLLSILCYLRSETERESLNKPVIVH